MNEKNLLKFGLEQTSTDSCGKPLYSLNKFDGEEFLYEKSGFVEAVLRYVQESDYWSSWVLLEHVSSSGDDREHAYSILASGEGTGGESSNLREARHTYIGDDGYVFYINPDNLNWCFEKLKKYFDFY